MNLKIRKEILLEKLNYVGKALSNKNLIPSLSGIKFELTEKGLMLICSDDDIVIKSFIPKQNILVINHLGNIILPGKYILEIIKKIPTDIITIETDGSIVLIKTNTSEYSLNGMDNSEYPQYNFDLTKYPVLIDKTILNNIINQTSFAISHQESRPILTGLNFNLENNLLEVTGTDSYRLAKKTVKINSQTKDKINIVIPGKNLIELTKILEDIEEEIEIHILNNNVLFKFNDILFQSRLLNGTYPNVSNLIPSDFELELLLDATEFYNMIDRTSLLSEKNIVQLIVEKQEIIMSSDSQEVGKVEERMLLKHSQTKNIKISFNAKYMMEALKSLQSKEILLLINNDIKPIIIKAPQNDTLIQLVLPIKTY